MPAPAAQAAVLLPQERSEAHRPPCNTRRETSRACHPSAPADQAGTSSGHTPRAREGVGKQGGTHRPPAAGFTLFDYLDLRAGRKGEVPLGVLRASGGPRVLRDGQLLGLVLHHLGGHGDNAWLVITPGVITPGLTYRRRDWRRPRRRAPQTSCAAKRRERGERTTGHMRGTSTLTLTTSRPNSRIRNELALRAAGLKDDAQCAQIVKVTLAVVVIDPMEHGGGDAAHLRRAVPNDTALPPTLPPNQQPRPDWELCGGLHRED